MLKTKLSLFFFILLLSPTLFAASVNINKASAKVIAESLNGVGQAKAQAIVEYRKKHGPFKLVNDITKVKGIGDAILKKNAKDILVK